MALTLRELLEKQRLEREAKEAGIPMRPVAQQTELKQALETIAKPGFGETTPKPEPQPREENSLLARLRKSGSLNGNELYGQSVPVGAPQQTSALNSVPQPGLPIPPSPSPQYTEDETENLRRNLAFLAANLDEEKVIGQVLRSTVKQIQEHPELNAVMVDSDFDLIVAAARRSMKFAVRKKEDRADGRGKKKAQADELAAFLKDQGIEL
jgi:hypothetical protein